MSNWIDLKMSLPMLMTLGVSGMPFVGTDIGGFAEAPTPELFTRWLQAGVFSPFMRVHSADGTPDQEPWSYGIQYEALNRRAIELRFCPDAIGSARLWPKFWPIPRVHGMVTSCCAAAL